jgi:hypothetical protein
MIETWTLTTLASINYFGRDLDIGDFGIGYYSQNLDISNFGRKPLLWAYG